MDWPLGLTTSFSVLQRTPILPSCIRANAKVLHCSYFIVIITIIIIIISFIIITLP
jgi:hypothetical protein